MCKTGAKLLILKFISIVGCPKVHIVALYLLNTDSLVIILGERRFV